MNFTKAAEAQVEDKKKIKIGAVSYLNTKPLIYGLESGLMQEEVELLMDYPSRIAQALLDDTIDIGLVPVAIIPELNEAHIVSSYGIAADGLVASVCLFSNVPLPQIKTILLDYQSRTSVMLVQYLVKEYWKINPEFKKAGEDFIQHIDGTVAAVVIGDRAFAQHNKSLYSYDLAEAWKLHTGLPFVFAAWVSNKPMTEAFIANFNKANEYGLDRLDEVVQQNPFTEFDLKKYYTEYIHFKLDDSKMNGLRLFLQYCEKPVEIAL